MSNLFGIDKHFYHGSVRRYVALFGSLFSDVYIRRDSTKDDYIKVPIRYGTGNMYLKAPQDGESRETKQVSRILPAMAFKLDNFYKDVNRKTNPMNRIQNVAFDSEDNKKYQFNRIPYNFIFELEIRTKNSDDMMQIVEQVVPAFDGNLSVTIQDTTGVAVEQDIIISLEEVAMEDNYDEEMQGRLIEWKLTFELRGFLYKRTLTGAVATEVGIQTFMDEYMVDEEDVTEQKPIDEEQHITSDMTTLIGGLASIDA